MGHLISEDGVRPNDNRIAALSRVPVPSDIKPLRSLLGDPSYYRTFLPNMSRRICPITALLKRRYVQIHFHHGGHRSHSSRRTHHTTDPRLPWLGRGH